MKEEAVKKCGLCGEPMPAGEQVFNYHGYSGPCPPKDSNVKDHQPDCPCFGDSTANGETVQHDKECRNCECEYGETAEWRKEGKLRKTKGNRIVQEEAVRDLVRTRGNLFDRWDMMANDTKGYLREVEAEFCNAVEKFRAALRRVEDTQ